MKQLETERLILRSWDLSDAEDLYEYAQSDLVGPNAGWKPHKDLTESKEIIKRFIVNDDVYAVELKSERKVIGSLGVHEGCPDQKFSDLNQRIIGYVLNPNYWGNGYIPEAVKGVVDFCFGVLNLDLIWCGHFDFNHNSRRVNEKCGFEYQFTKVETLHRLDNKKVSILYYNLNRNNYI